MTRWPHILILILRGVLVGRRQSIAWLVACEVVNFLKSLALQPDETGRARRKAELAGDKSFGNSSRAVPSFPPRVKTSRAASDLCQEHFLIPSYYFGGLWP